MKSKSIRERISKLAAANKTLDLDAQHALFAVMRQTKLTPERAVRIAQDRADFIVAVEKLKAVGLLVHPNAASTNLVRLVWADESAETYAQAAEAVHDKFFAGGEPPPMPSSKPTAKTAAKKPAEKPEQLDWAFRRLRRQAVVFFAATPESQPELRRRLGQIQSGYGELKRAFTGDDNDLMKLSSMKAAAGEKGADAGWEAFMEWFFAHTITPGSRAQATE